MIAQFTDAAIDGETTEVKSKVGRFPLTSRDRWLTQTLNNIKFRCTNPKDKRFQYYGGRGIRCLLTLEDLRIIYERDRPDLMLKPSIDRIDNESNYYLANCRFLELRENIARKERRQWPCSTCGAITFVTPHSRLCHSCFELKRLKETKYPDYVRYVIDQAAIRGFEVEGVLAGNNYGRKKMLQINGHEVRVHYAAVVTHISGKANYWKFSVAAGHEFHALVARHRKTFHCFILSGAPLSPILYIPILEKDRCAQRSMYDWESLKDAWHLLASNNGTITHAPESTASEG